MKRIFKRELPLVLLALLFSVDAFAFNFRQCDRFLAKHGYFAGPVTTMQFTTSTGACSSTASVSEMQKRFFIVNYDKIMKDFARGSGEYSNGFFKYTSCQDESKNTVIMNIKSQFSNLINLNEEESFILIKDLIQMKCHNV